MGNSFSQSNTLSRRYELPTCLLEVWTERSSLSDWQSQVVAQNLHFRLQLAHGHKVIKGNQQQILSLIEAITAYCDRWLSQDELVSLNHDIDVPKLPKLRLSTLQLFDLYESLELCANEFVILPSLVLEVRRLSPNWLKIVAGAIAIIGLSIGAIRLVSREQPSWQMAGTPTTSEQTLQPLESVPPVAVLEPNTAAKSESKIAPTAEIKTGRQEMSPSTAQPNFEIAPIVPAAPTPYLLEKSPSAPQDFNAKNNAAQNNQVAITTPDLSRGRGSVADSSALPSVATSSTKPRPSSSSSSSRVGAIADDKLQMDRTIALESAPPALAPSARMASPSTLGASGNAQNNQAALTTNIKVLQIQSELPNEVNTALVNYLQEQSFTTTAGVVALDVVVVNDRISQIEIDRQVTSIEDKTAIAKLEDLLRQLRSPQASTGKFV